MKTKLDILATAAIRKSSWLTRCKVPKCDLIAAQQMYDTARKIEDNLEMYWCLSRYDKKVTYFQQCVEDAGIYVVLASFATGVHGCRRECGATDLCWREGGGGRGVRPFLFSTENSHIVAYSLPCRLRGGTFGPLERFNLSTGSDPPPPWDPPPFLPPSAPSLLPPAPSLPPSAKVPPPHLLSRLLYLSSSLLCNAGAGHLQDAATCCGVPCHPCW